MKYSLLGEDNIEKWSKQIIDSFIIELKKYDKKHTFSRNTLYSISHVAALDTEHWIISFKDYVKDSPYFMDWIARVISYQSNTLEWNELLRAQLHFPHWENRGIWMQIVANSKYHENPILKDFVKILYTDLESLQNSSHSYIDYVKEYWIKNDLNK